MIGTLSKLGALSNFKGPNPLRTSSVEGVFELEPKIGWPFTIYGESLTPGAAARVVSTSEVKRILLHDGKRIVFETENSRYELMFE